MPKLRDMVDALANQNDDNGAYYDTVTGELVTIPHALVGMLETDADLDERWIRDQFEQVLLARLLQTTPDRLLLLPDQRERRDWEIMAAFVDDLPEGDERAALADSLQGRGAFKRFKTQVYELGLLDSWFTHRRRAYETLIRRWAVRHGVTLSDAE